MPIHLSRAVKIAALQWDMILTKILIKYSNYVDTFSIDLAIKLLENISINDHAIKSMKENQLSYGSIYALSLIILEILKIYIETDLKNYGYIIM